MIETIDWYLILKEPWVWNTIAIIGIMIISSLYSHIEYMKLKSLYKKYKYHHLAAHITMRESGIFTKYWVRAFVRGAERWF